MRVLRVDMNYPRDISPGGGQHVYYNSFCSDYDELILISKKNGNLLPNRPGVKIIEINQDEGSLAQYSDNILKKIWAFFGKLIAQYKFLSKSKRYIKEFKPQVVHLYSPIPIFCGIYSKWKFGSKVLISLHGSDMLRISKNNFMGIVFRFADAIVSVSDNTMELENNSYINKPIRYIGNGVDLKLFKNKHKERKNIFIHIGGLRWQKGQEYLLHGFALFLKDKKDYILEIIGDGPRRKELEDLCCQLNISDNVVFEGIQGREQIVDMLNVSKAFVLTSVSEGFPKVIIEAMATGTPVISSDVGNVKSVIMDSGIIFPQKSPDAVADAMKQIVSSQEEWIRHSSLSEKYSEEYSWEMQAKKLHHIYNEILVGNQKSK